MKARTLLITTLIAAAGLAAAFYVTRPPARSTAAPLGPLCPDLAAKGDATARVIIRTASGEVVLERRDQAWVAPSKGGYPADRTKVVDLVRALADAKLLEPRTSKPDLYPRLKVEDVSAPGAGSKLVRLEDAAGAALAEVLVGTAQGAGQDATFYCRRVGEAGSFLASGSVPAETDALAWLNKTFAEIANERIRSATVRHAAGPIHVHRARPADQTFTLDGLPEGRELRDEYTLTRLAWALSFATFDDVAPAAGVSLGDAPLVTELRGFDGLLVTIRQGTIDNATWITLSAAFEAPPAPAAAEGEAAPAAITEPSAELAAEIARLNAAWTPWAFKIPEYKATVLRSTMEDFLKPLAPPTPPAPPPS